MYELYYSEKIGEEYNDGDCIKALIHKNTGEIVFIISKEKTAYEMVNLLNKAQEKETVKRGIKLNNRENPPHRKKRFSKEEVNEIRYKYTHFNTPKKELARQYKCSPKTIRNIINNAY